MVPGPDNEGDIMSAAPVVLATAAQIIIRPDAAIQFGVDATRAGVLEVEPHLAAGIVPVLLALRRPAAIGLVVDKLTAAGMSATAAGTLLEDLRALGVLREATARQVLMFGQGALVDATAALLESAGWTPRTPLRGEKPTDFLKLPAAGVLVLNRLAHATTLAPLFARRAPTYLSAALLDSRGLIGPGRRNGRGPCLMCVDLHRSDIDPHWHALVTQQPNGPTHPDPVALSATAARLAALVERDSWQAGDTEEIDIYTGEFRRSRITVHPRCPVCWR